MAEKENKPSEEERVLQVALRILEQHKKAFQELAKEDNTDNV